MKKTILTSILVTAVIGSSANLMNLAAYSKASYIEKYYKKATTVTFQNDEGYKKISKDNKNVKFKKGRKSVRIKFKSGKSVVRTISKTGQRKNYKIYIDTKEPTIQGVQNFGSYTGSVSVMVSDNMKLNNVKLNGKTVQPFFAVADPGTYTLVAQDMAGNKNKVIFSVAEQIVTNEIPNGAVATTAANQATKAPVSNTGSVVSEKPSDIGRENPTISVLPATQVPLTENSIIETTLPPIFENGPLSTVDVPATKVPMVQPTQQVDGLPMVTSAVGPVVSESPQETPEIFGPLYSEEPVLLPSITPNNQDEEIECEHKFVMKPEIETSMKSKATCTEPSIYYYVCDKCGTLDANTYVYGEALGHNYKEGLVTGEEEQIISVASCTQPTVYKKACANGCCGEEKYEKVNGEYVTWNGNDQLVHSYHTKLETEAYLCAEATCEKAATYYYKCDTCGKSAKTVCNVDTNSEYIYESDTNIAVGHDWKDARQLGASETEYKKHIAENNTDNDPCMGVNRYYMKCSKCHKYVDQSSLKELATNITFSVPAKGHSYEDDMAIITHHPLFFDLVVPGWSCSSPKQYYKRCKDCGYVNKNEVVTTDIYKEHSWSICDLSKEHIAEKASCLHGTKYYLYCLSCEKYADEVYNLKNGELSNPDNKNEQIVYEDTSDKVTSTTSLEGHGNVKIIDGYENDCTFVVYYCEDCDRDIKVSTGLTHDFTEKSGRAKVEPTLTTPGEYYYKCSRCSVYSEKTYIGELLNK